MQAHHTRLLRLNRGDFPDLSLRSSTIQQQVSRRNCDDSLNVLMDFFVYFVDGGPSLRLSSIWQRRFRRWSPSVKTTTTRRVLRWFSNRVPEIFRFLISLLPAVDFPDDRNHLILVCAANCLGNGRNYRGRRSGSQHSGQHRCLLHIVRILPG